MGLVVISRWHSRFPGWRRSWSWSWLRVVVGREVDNGEHYHRSFGDTNTRHCHLKAGRGCCYATSSSYSDSPMSSGCDCDYVHAVAVKGSSPDSPSVELPLVVAESMSRSRAGRTGRGHKLEMRQPKFDLRAPQPALWLEMNSMTRGFAVRSLASSARTAGEESSPPTRDRPTAASFGEEVELAFDHRAPPPLAAAVVAVAPSLMYAPREQPLVRCRAAMSAS